MDPLLIEVPEQIHTERFMLRSPRADAVEQECIGLRLRCCIRQRHGIERTTVRIAHPDCVEGQAARWHSSRRRRRS